MEKPDALRRVKQAAKARDRAAQAYAEALNQASESGASWAEIAKAAGAGSAATVFRFARRHSS